jgi:hypothetical protein
MLRRGTISHANALAAECGVEPGMPCRKAAQLLTAAPQPARRGAALGESRRVVTPAGAARRIVLIDSAALVEPEDAGEIVVTGSHGGLVGGNPAKALKIDAFAAFFNDAGGGCEDAGYGRLPALETRGIAAATVSSDSARIGDADSTYRDGAISAFNERARDLGAHTGLPARAFIDALTEIRDT